MMKIILIRQVFIHLRSQ